MQSSKANEGYMGPLYLPGFHLQTDPVTETTFLFHPRTGEVLFGCDCDGNAANANRRYSFWTRPSEIYTCVAQMKQDHRAIHNAEQKWKKECSGHDNTNSNRKEVRDKLLQEEGLIGYYGPRIAKKMAIMTIQKFARMIHDKRKVRKRIHELYEKIFDEPSGYFFFHNKLTGQSQWHRPYGLGNSGEYDLPETVPPPKEEPVVKIANQARQNMINGKTYPSTDYLKDIHIKDGPYFVRQPNQPSKKVKKEIIHSKHNPPLPRYEKNLPISNHPNDLLDALNNSSLEDSGRKLFGARYQCSDGLVLKKVTVEPYALLRSGYEKGVKHVLNVLKRYHQNRHVICFGCIMLAKYEYLENGDGMASHEALEVRDFCLSVMEEWRSVEHLSILVASISVLVSLTDIYANRVAMNEVNWIDKLKVCTTLLHSTMQPESKFDSDSGEWKMVEVELATTSSIDLAIQTCRLLSNMAYDEAHRTVVAENGFPIVVKCMKFCYHDATLQRYACLAIFNFLYRNEANHTQACDENVSELVSSIIDRFGENDEELLAVCERTLSILLPDGWRLVD